MTFIEDFYMNPDDYITYTDLMEQRALFVLNYAFDGLDISFEDAMDIIRGENIALTDEEKQQKEMLINLVDNLINFSVAEEYQTLSEMRSDLESSDNKDDFITSAIATFERYNKNFASVENSDILFALGLAAEWINWDSKEIIEYKTQEDERVRVSHQLLNGLRYRKEKFPPALVPPIDWGCRCYLLNTSSTDGRTLTNKTNDKELIKTSTNPVFKHNVAESGIMFSKEHPYFDVQDNHVSALKTVINKIKSRLEI